MTSPTHIGIIFVKQPLHNGHKSSGGGEMFWRYVSVLGLGINVLATTTGFSSPVVHHQHHWRHDTLAPSLSPPFVRPNNDKYYIGWSRVPGSYRSAGDGWVYFGPQYTFVPGRGIVDEACNLPTSACPNTQ